MSEQPDHSQEKTEDATPRREEKAREEGRVPRSRELNTATILITGCAALFFYGSLLADKMKIIFYQGFSVRPEEWLRDDIMFVHLRFACWEAMKAVAPFFVLLIVAAFAAPMMLGGWNFSIKSISFQSSRINPMSGLKRMFSVHALIELLKALAKFILLAVVTVILLWKLRYPLMGLGNSSLEAAMTAATYHVLWAALILSSGLLLIAFIDVPYQLWDTSQKLKMTKQEVRDEMKDSEGKPEVKSRLRQMQRQIAQRRMMSAIPQADVIITNPTHYSVALKYDMTNMSAPILLASGTDLVALKIREIATAHKIDIVEAPPLARAIYFTTEVNQEIPSGLYLAVAQVLAYVFQLKNHAKGLGDKPVKPEHIKLPEDYRFN